MNFSTSSAHSSLSRFFDRPFVLPSVVLGVSFFLAASVASHTFYAVRSLDNTLSVTGSAKKAVTSDTVEWNSNISRVTLVDQLSDGYRSMGNDLSVVKSYFKTRGVDEKDVTIAPIVMEQIYDSSNEGPKRYTLRQNITVKSHDVQKITDLSKNLQSIIDKGVIFSSSSPAYYFSGIAPLRVELLSDAIKDAKARAAKLAESGDSSVGSLKSASSGVVQVLAPNSVDVDDYGSYDTSTIDKEVMLTVRASFDLR